MNSRQARQDLTDTLHLDLIGPPNGHSFERELLSETPTAWYLAGYLVPADAGDDLKVDDSAEEEIDSVPKAGGFDDDAPVDRSAAGNNYLSSSMGMTTIVPAEAKTVTITVEWGDYIEEQLEVADDSPEDGKKKIKYGYRRSPKTSSVEISLADLDPIQQTRLDVPDSKVRPGDESGLMLSCIARSVPHLASGCKAFTVFLVNYRSVDTDHSYRSCAFQTRFTIHCPAGLVGRPDLRGTAASHLVDSDNSIADLHYRDVLEYSVGHGTSVNYTPPTDGAVVNSVITSWLPTHEVEKVIPSIIDDVEFRMFTLAGFETADELADSLDPMVTSYQSWIEAQESIIETLDTDARKSTAKTALNEARSAASRIEEGIELLRNDHDAFRAFSLANLSMGEAADRRLKDVPREKVAWRPFQLAFVLLNLPGLIDPKNQQREYVELLFFPTGGGKTEAYLGLAAFQIVFRRLTVPGIRSSGLSVLMRYTLRLLTLDQLGRASALICSLELERRKDPELLGDWPFEIGLWVGSAATPNRLGCVGYNGPGADQTAYIRTKRFRENSAANSAPIPLESCPWCETKFGKSSFKMIPSEKAPTHLKISCSNYECDFSQGTGLPILTVDETIYRRLPCFLIATVDKFAAMPWEGRAGALFGRVNRYDQKGFYGPTDPSSMGTKMDDILPGPDLIIQDELHLISGPLGTIAGVYETAIEKLSERFASDGRQRKVPKIIASTATVRRASQQIQALFGRPTTRIFPPPGINRSDSFFAETVEIDENNASTNGRLYLGVAAQGRSLKRVLLRSMLTIMSRAETLYRSGDPDAKESVDAYMTSLGYFNSLRELGGSRRIVEDEVLMQLDRYSSRRRLDPPESLFSDRTIDMSHIKELTSRVSTNEVSSTKERMGKVHSEGLGCDVVLATNMISVGLDVTRLGLMFVLSQPKGSSEYIQATSRVGREAKHPGLVITLLNPHKPRDRSHFEQFKNFHESFYRSVEATSVTPYSPRALDRALAATLVGVIRHSLENMTSSLGATQILDVNLNKSLDDFCILLAERAGQHRQDLKQEARDELYHYVLNRCRGLIDDWRSIAKGYQSGPNVNLKYQTYEDGNNAKPLLHAFLDPELDNLQPEFMNFRANRSMRDVETNTELKIRELTEPLTNEPKKVSTQ
ncbi:MAG: DISARM system helicase DrmA [Verrucomicrobiales bacterium]|nr:DISARM system helicase DrmA [Verrucomicrobiales bacterium]